MSMRNRIVINIYRYNTTLHINNITDIKSLSKTIVHDILNNGNMSHFRSLNIVPGLLEQLNLMFTEKMVKRLDENFPVYYSAIRPSLHYPRSRRYRLPQNLRYLTRKYFSGDVSGMLAESLFIYLLSELGIDISIVGHLRPEKIRNSYTPDFVIWDDSQAIHTLVSEKCTSPVYAEVKGSTRDIDPERLEKALKQLKNLLLDRDKCGVVFYVYRSPDYVGLVVEVQP